MTLYKKIALSLLLTGYLLPSQAKDPDYSALLIPANLKENAHAVKRMEEYTVKVVSPGDVRVSQHYVITVLDEKGARFARLSEYYNKLREIRSIKGYLYDAFGKEVSKMKEKDVSDMSGVGNGTLMSDDRSKEFAFNYKVYPYTVEYELEFRYNQGFYVPGWVPQEGEEYAVAQSKMTVIVPAANKLRYKAFNYTGEPVVANDKDGTSYTWEIKDKAALPDETYVPGWYYRTTSVLLALSSFTVQDFNGTSDTWDQVGQFVYTLNQGRDVLPDDVKKKVHELSDGKSEKEKISILYRYLQQHTHYINVSLGIGGWQTHEATYVATKGYGDCKALSNYMVALLKEAGVKANYVLVKAGDHNTEFVADFPSTQFNHMIACVPGAKDTTWLECTSQSLPAGYLSAFTAGRPVLLISDKGSKLVHTPSYTMDQNLQVRKITATVAETGDMMVNANTHFTGLQQDDLQEMIHRLSKDKIMERLREGHIMPSYDVNKYETKEEEGVIPAIDELIEINSHSYASVSGKRMFIEPNLMSKNGRKLDGAKARVAAISVDFPYRDIDTVVINVPAGYKAESLPQPPAVKSVFGEYTASIQVKDNQIIYIRRFDHQAGTFPASAWGDFAAFNNAVYKADRAKIVLVKE